jgi:hypothetical protein
MMSLSSKPGPSGFKKRKYPLCDADEESVSDMLNEVPIIDYDEMYLEIEEETASEESSNEMSESERERVKEVALVLMGGKK